MTEVKYFKTKDSNEEKMYKYTENRVRGAFQNNKKSWKRTSKTTTNAWLNLQWTKRTLMNGRKQAIALTENLVN